MSVVLTYRGVIEGSLSPRVGGMLGSPNTQVPGFLLLEQFTRALPDCGEGGQEVLRARGW